jgi:hypothetical protein
MPVSLHGLCGGVYERAKHGPCSPAPLAASTRADSLPRPVLQPVMIATCSMQQQGSTYMLEQHARQQARIKTKGQWHVSWVTALFHHTSAYATCIQQDSCATCA